MGAGKVNSSEERSVPIRKAFRTNVYRDTQDLFAYAEIEDEQRWNAIAETEVCRRWWRYMREIMPSSADNSPISSELKEVFRL